MMVVRRLESHDASLARYAVATLKITDGDLRDNLSDDYLCRFLARPVNYLIVATEDETPVGYLVAYEGGASVCWDAEEWSRGAYAWFRPGQMETLWPHFARPEGRIHFVGDHLSPWPGWMNGALQSGYRGRLKSVRRISILRGLKPEGLMLNLSLVAQDEWAK